MQVVVIVECCWFGCIGFGMYFVVQVLGCIDGCYENGVFEGYELFLDMKMGGLVKLFVGLRLSCWKLFCSSGFSGFGFVFFGVFDGFFVWFCFFWVVVGFVFGKVGVVQEVQNVVGWLCVVVELMLDVFVVQNDVVFGVFGDYWVLGIDFFEEVVIVW